MKIKTVRLTERDAGYRRYWVEAKRASRCYLNKYSVTHNVVRDVWSVSKGVSSLDRHGPTALKLIQACKDHFAAIEQVEA